mmetsp:Transcript_5748/g.23592  ORF Transcript_5748/g.23592 Transcript_5748/m.23592 type:complete len:299 (+) Transcript_5748:819-1715(+)
MIAYPVAADLVWTKLTLFHFSFQTARLRLLFGVHVYVNAPVSPHDIIHHVPYSLHRHEIVQLVVVQRQQTLHLGVVLQPTQEVLEVPLAKRAPTLVHLKHAVQVVHRVPLHVHRPGKVVVIERPRAVLLDDHLHPRLERGHARSRGGILGIVRRGRPRRLQILQPLRRVPRVLHRVPARPVVTQDPIVQLHVAEALDLVSPLVLRPVLGVFSHHPSERVYVLLTEHPVLVCVEHPEHRGMVELHVLFQIPGWGEVEDLGELQRGGLAGLALHGPHPVHLLGEYLPQAGGPAPHASDIR